MKLLFLLLISYVIFPVCLPDVLFCAEQECFYSCCPTCQHDPCLCSMPLDDMVTSEIPSTDDQQPMRGKCYQCTYPGCKATYKYPSSLKKHGRTHTGERPYKCQYPGCKYTSAQSNDLKKHGRTHIGEKPYKCPYPDCEYAATNSGDLTNHKRIHTGERPYECPHPGCKYAAAQSNDLVKHRRTHIGEKPYKCPYPDCEYAAARSDVLRMHKRTHTGEKPYKCNSCEGKYLRFFQLRAHSKRIHGIEIPPKKESRPPKRTQKNLDNDEAGAPEDQEPKRVHRGDL